MTVTTNASQPVGPSTQSGYEVTIRQQGKPYDRRDGASRPLPPLVLQSGAVYQVGADPSNDLILTNDGPIEVALNHAQISYQSGEVSVRRLAVNKDVQLGTKLLDPMEEARWDPDVDLRIGPYTLRINEKVGKRDTADDQPISRLARSVHPAGVTLDQKPLALGLTPGTLQLTPGEPSRWSVWLQNNDNSRNHKVVLDFKTAPPLAADWVVRPGSSELVFGHPRSTNLDVVAERIPSNEAGRYRLTITARAIDNETLKDSVQRDLIVGAYLAEPDVVIEPGPVLVSSARYTVLITNLTNTIVSYRLAAADDDGRDNIICKFYPVSGYDETFEQDNLVVYPGTTGRVQLHVTGRPGRQLSELGYTVRIDITPLGQSTYTTTAIFMPRWSRSWQIDRRVLIRGLIWSALVMMLIVLVVAVAALINEIGNFKQAAVQNANASAAVQAASSVAMQLTQAQNGISTTLALNYQTMGPFLTSTAQLGATAQTVATSLANSAATVSAVAGTATMGAQQLPQQLTAIANSTQQVGTQVANLAGITAAAEHGAQTAAAAPVQTVMVAETSKTIAEQNATSVNAAAAQAAAAAAQQTAAAAATIIANDTKPVRLTFKQQPTISVSAPTDLGIVIVALLDKDNRVTTRDGYSIVISLTGCGSATLSGTKIRTSVQGLVTFDNLAVASKTTNTCRLLAKEINGSLSPVQSDKF